MRHVLFQFGSSFSVSSSSFNSWFLSNSFQFLYVSNNLLYKLLLICTQFQLFFSTEKKRFIEAKFKITPPKKRKKKKEIREIERN